MTYIKVSKRERAKVREGNRDAARELLISEMTYVFHVFDAQPRFLGEFDTTAIAGLGARSIG